MGRFGTTDDDRGRMGDFLSKSYQDRTVGDLQPDDDEEEE